jgi:hypothetical protein
MTNRREEPRRTEQSKELAAARRARLAAELRANLARRKAQSRGRAVDEEPPRSLGD